MHLRGFSHRLPHKSTFYLPSQTFASPLALAATPRYPPVLPPSHGQVRRISNMNPLSYQFFGGLSGGRQDSDGNEPRETEQRPSYDSYEGMPTQWPDQGVSYGIENDSYGFQGGSYGQAPSIISQAAGGRNNGYVGMAIPFLQQPAEPQALSAQVEEAPRTYPRRFVSERIWDEAQGHEETESSTQWKPINGRRDRSSQERERWNPYGDYAQVGSSSLQQHGAPLTSSGEAPSQTPQLTSQSAPQTSPGTSLQGPLQGGKKAGKKPYELPSKRKKARAKAKAEAPPPRQPSPSHRSPSPPSATRAPPSPASGGIPDPTSAYLETASLPSRVLTNPRKILVVIDLNGTILFRPEPRSKPKHFVARPYAKEFLTYCLETFSVLIWSSARPDNVHSMCQNIIPAKHRNLVVDVWSRDRFGLSQKDYNRKVQCYKRLTTVWGDAKIQAVHPDGANGGRWDQSNTVLVDDSIEKARAEPYNLIEIPEFTKGLKGDTMLPQVHDYLNKLCFQVDVSCYMRENPFKAKDQWEPQDSVGP